MKKTPIYFHFYKEKFAFPLGLSLFTLFGFRIMPLAVMALITATLLIWFYQRFINDKKKQSLYFYYNLGMTEIKLYSFLLFINLIILTGINSCIK